MQRPVSIIIAILPGAFKVKPNLLTTETGGKARKADLALLKGL